MNPLQNFLKNYGVGSKFTGLDSYTKKTPSANTPVATASPAAVNPQPNPIKPPVTPPVGNNSSRDQFVTGLTQEQFNTNLANYNKANPSAPTTTTTPPPSTTGSTPPPAKKSDPYQTYLSSIFDPKQAKLAQDNINSLNQRTADELKYAREKEDYIRKNEVGQLRAGQSYDLGENSRLSNKSLADLAIAKGASVDILKQITDAGKAGYDLANKANEPIEVGGQLYQRQDDGSYKSVAGSPSVTDQYGTGAIGEYNFAKSQGYTGSFTDYQNEDANRKKSIAAAGISGGFSGTLSPLAQAVQNGTIALDKLPAADRSRVAAELAASGIQSGRQQTLSSSLDSVNALLNNPNLSKITGYVQGKLRLGDLDPRAQLALNQFNQIKGILSLENREKLKGSGAISDFEFKVLSDAATALGRNLGDAEFRTELQKVKDVFEGKYRQTTNTGGTQTVNSNSSGVTPSGIKYTIEQ